jgi:hypothetical protein
MIDNIELRLDWSDRSQIPRIKSKVKIHWEAENGIPWKGYLENLKISENQRGITIHGSIAKFLLGNNCEHLSRRTTEDAIHQLESSLELDLSTAIVRQLEFGYNFIVQEKPNEYLNLFTFMMRRRKQIYSYTGELQTVFYDTDTGYVAFSGYDKIAEMNKRNKEIPAIYLGKNILRLEYRIRKRSGIKKIFGHDLFAYDIFNEDVYEKLKKEFIKYYQLIPKNKKKLLVTSVPTNLTPSKFKNLWAEQQRQTYPDEYLAFLLKCHNNKLISNRDFKKIRRENRKSGNNFKEWKSDPLITELDEQVDKKFMFAP